MYSSVELIQKSAARNLLNRLFTETLSDMPQKVINIADTSNIDLSIILSQLDDEDVLITNDNYSQENCDYQVVTKRGKIILTINDDGSVINGYSQQEYLDDSLCEQLSRLYDTLRYNCTNICTITAAA